jgi:hypothetical protein
MSRDIYDVFGMDHLSLAVHNEFDTIEGDEFEEAQNMCSEFDDELELDDDWPTSYDDDGLEDDDDLFFDDDDDDDDWEDDDDTLDWD